MNAIEQLKSVLCNHDGKCCIAGSEEDRAIVDRALQALAQPEYRAVKTYHEGEPVYVAQQEQRKYRRGDRLICLETEEYCVIHISGTDRQWVKFPDSHIGVYTNEQVAELFELLPKEPEQEPVAWRNAAIRLGEELSSVGPVGYYDMTAAQWLDWAMAQEPRGKYSLTQPEQDPVAWVCYGMGDKKDIDFEQIDVDALAVGTMLYTTPPHPQQEQNLLCKSVQARLATAWGYVKAQSQQEPVGRFAKFTDGIWREVTDGSAGVPLYTNPPQPEQNFNCKSVQARLATAWGYVKAQSQQEPVAWMHNFIEGGISIGSRPADLERHPDRWTALFKDPKPCPTCEALARTVMLDQTSHDAGRTWVGLTVKEIYVMYQNTRWSYEDQLYFAIEIEAKLKEKNT